jgi:uncharacterized protein
MSDKNKVIIDKANKAFEQNDVEALLALCTEGFTWTMVGSPAAVGKAAVREWMAKAPPGMPTFTIDAVIADGDYVTCVGDMTMPENGHDVPYAYCDVWRLEGERIAELKAFVIKTKK